MSFSIKGKLSQKLSIESGVAKSGNEWKKQSFVLDTDAQYNPLICFKLFGEEKINLLTNFKEGEMIEVFVNLSSKEYNGRYFHNIDAWKIQQINNEIYDDEPPPVFENDLDKEDDLPF